MTNMIEIDKADHEVNSQWSALFSVEKGYMRFLAFGILTHSILGKFAFFLSSTEFLNFLKTIIQ